MVAHPLIVRVASSPQIFGVTQGLAPSVHHQMLGPDVGVCTRLFPVTRRR